MGWPGARFRPRPRRAVERRGALRGATAGQGICAIAGIREQRLIWPIGFSQRRLEAAAYQGDHARGRRNPQLCRRAFGPHVAALSRLGFPRAEAATGQLRALSGRPSRLPRWPRLIRTAAASRKNWAGAATGQRPEPVQREGRDASGRIDSGRGPGRRRCADSRPSSLCGIIAKLRHHIVLCLTVPQQTDLILGPRASGRSKS